MSGFSANVTAAQKAVWPHVRDWLSNRGTTAVLRDTWPEVRDNLAKYPGSRSQRKHAVEQTVWWLARNGWLITPAQRAVLAAAKNWYAGDPDYLRADNALYNAMVDYLGGV